MNKSSRRINLFRYVLPYATSKRRLDISFVGNITTCQYILLILAVRDLLSPSLAEKITLVAVP
jgi:hypothetical protein